MSNDGSNNTNDWPVYCHAIQVLALGVLLYSMGIWLIARQTPKQTIRFLFGLGRRAVGIVNDMSRIDDTTWFLQVRTSTIHEASSSVTSTTSTIHESMEEAMETNSTSATNEFTIHARNTNCCIRQATSPSSTDNNDSEINVLVRNNEDPYYSVPLCELEQIRRTRTIAMLLDSENHVAVPESSIQSFDLNVLQQYLVLFGFMCHLWGLGTLFSIMSTLPSRMALGILQVAWMCGTFGATMWYFRRFCRQEVVK